MTNPTSADGTRLLDYGHSRLVAVFDTSTEAQAATDELTACGLGEAFDVHCGQEAARRIDFSGADHGPLARMSRALHTLTAEGTHMEHYERELQAGHCVVIAATKNDDDARTALRVFEAHGGHFINQFDFWTVETVHA